MFKEDLKKLGLVFVFLVIALKIVFYKEDIFTVLKYVVSLFWVMILPGFFLMYIFGKLTFFVRLIVGSGVGVAVISIIIWYLGLIGINLRYSTYVIPLLIIIAGYLIGRKNIN